jgi:hypothetical protein
MFKYKNAMISMAVVAMLAACGGGGGGGNDDDNGNPSNPPAGGGGDTVVTSENLSGAAVSLDTAGILVPQATETIPVTYAQFSDTTPRDAASGNEGGYGTFTGEPYGTAAPLRFFGVRVLDEAGDAVSANDSKPGRLVFQFQDNDAVVAAQRENLSIEIDNVTTTRTGGEISIALGEGAQVHVSARNSAGDPSGVVSLAATAAMFTVTDNEGTNDIILNVDTIVAAAVDAAAEGTAKTVMTSVRNFGSTVREPFAVSMTLTNVDFANAAAATSGANVKVGTRNTVSGEGGVSGFVQSIPPGSEVTEGGGDAPAGAGA